MWSDWAQFVSELFVCGDSKSLDFTKKVWSMCFVKSDDADVPVRLLKCGEKHFIRDTRPREISPGLTCKRQANLYGRIRPFVTNPWKDVLPPVPNEKSIAP